MKRQDRPEEYKSLLHRRYELASQRLDRPLTGEEERELRQVTEDLDDFERPWYQASFAEFRKT
jgi:hypothetical protein